ncbi:MAG TPA: cellulase family glycosylhydrolase [Flavisolibacter sp.]|jgi:aryl-phospho-beta-D-glucosidase BglC (GH1 family)|nr:cellulase family glycosylhydrolase [Flavisolibacter sp.]
MKKLYRLPLIFCLCLSTAFAQQGGFFTTKGKEVLSPDGKPFIMRGTNLGNWLVPEGYMFRFSSVNSPRLINQVLHELIGPSATDSFWKTYLSNYITHDDIRYLKAIGVNSIRLPFNYRLFTDEKYMGQSNPDHGFQLFDQLLDWCRKESMPVMLDMHCAPGGQTGDNIDDGDGYPFLFESEKDQKLTAEIWMRIADRYKNEPLILGYDLLNEPIAHYFDASHFNPKLEGLYKRITDSIRKVDKNHIILLGGAQWNSNFAPFGPPFDSKLIYTFHKYWTKPTQEVIQPYIDFRDKYNVPIYCGETGENTNGWIDSFRTTMEGARIGWHFWPYKKLDNTRGFVQIKKPPFYDSIIHYAESPRASFADIRKARPKDMQQIRRALNDYLQGTLLQNCLPNEGYIKALGFATNVALPGSSPSNAKTNSSKK